MVNDEPDLARIAFQMDVLVSGMTQVGNRLEELQKQMVPREIHLLRVAEVDRDMAEVRSAISRLVDQSVDVQRSLRNLLITIAGGVVIYVLTSGLGLGG